MVSLLIDHSYMHPVICGVRYVSLSQPMAKSSPGSAKPPATHIFAKKTAPIESKKKKNDVLLGLEASNLGPHRFQTVSTCGHMEHGQSDYLPLQPFHIAYIASWVSVLQPGYSPQIAAPGRLALEPTRSHPGGAGSAPLWETSARYI